MDDRETPAERASPPPTPPPASSTLTEEPHHLNGGDINRETSVINRIPETEAIGADVPVVIPGTEEDVPSESHSSGSLRRSKKAHRKRSRKSSVDGESRKRQKKTELGFPNAGNTCFMNATLQGLYSIPDFCRDVMRQEALWGPGTDSILPLQRYIGELYRARQGQWDSKGKKKLLRSVKSSLAVYNEEYNYGSQQDAHEFLMLLLMGLKMESEAMFTTPGYTCPTARFDFKIQCVRACASCGDKVYQEEEHNNLSLDVSSSLEDSLKLFFEPSELECTCQKCLGHQATVTRSFLTLPRVLVLHMKRFSYDGRQMRRLGDAVTIPPLLTLATPNKESISDTGSELSEHLSPLWSRLSCWEEN
ncbi:ubiquitin carboxyl-terminal hydrolase 37-like [Myripristis murdjan]|uniref:ubiquitin carboxyl-terminal hydrolase 37-like n=1 Tax=Myripristis murdjan TaxID=586833 RepID=UPI001175D555|nr:ubiquitin carboxyl-terminal hydrolase 37-like [Myripristis murdjan]